MTVQDAYVVSAIRTPVAKYKGQLRDVLPENMLSHLIGSLIDRYPQLDLNEIGDVIVGCAMPEAEQGMNIARIASLLGGLPDSVPGMTINRFCSSGLQSIALAAQSIQLGQSDLMLAGGVESMTMIPMGGYHYTANPAWFSGENKHRDIALSMGLTAERVAKKWGVTRELQDKFSLQSHQRAIDAIKADKFKQEIVPMSLTTRMLDAQQLEVKSATRIFDQDEGPRSNTSLEQLAKLRTVFAARGSVTAGNSSQMSDGAGLVMLASEAALKRYELKPLARFCGYQVAGVPADIMGIGPVAAVPKLLKRTSTELAKISWIELNEAFAAQALAVMKELQFNPDIVNPLGGAIALGHPLGATGAIRTATCLHGLKPGQYGLVTMCIGTGMGAAGLFERLS